MNTSFPDPQKTFDNFIINRSSQFASTVMSSSIRSLFKPYRFSTIYGPRFSGKSHLLNAFANEVRKATNSIRPMSLGAKDFPAFLECKTDSLANSAIKVFCVDDLEKIHSMPEAWAWLTDSLLEVNRSGGHVVLACNVNEMGIGTLSDWVDQFEDTLIADMAPYSFAEHREILLKTRLSGTDIIPIDVLDFVISISRRDIDKMKAAIGEITDEIRWFRKDITIDLVREIFQCPQ